MIIVIISVVIILVFQKIQVHFSLSTSYLCMHKNVLKVISQLMPIGGTSK